MAPRFPRIDFRPANGGILAALDRGNFKLDTDLTLGSGSGRIRCPHCKWQPKATSVWTCTSAGAPEHFLLGCGHSWNTFDTAGRCPGCNYVWRHTMCLKCNRWAIHDAWYERSRDRSD